MAKKLKKSKDKDPLYEHLRSNHSNTMYISDEEFDKLFKGLENQAKVKRSPLYKLLKGKK